MRGHLQRRGSDTWRLKVYVGRDANGTKRYVERTVNGTKKEAESELARLVVEADEGRHVATGPVTFDELLDQWLAIKAQQVEASTLGSYRWVAKTYVRPALGDRRLTTLRPYEIDRLYADLSARGLSPRTVRICHTLIRQSLEQARRWGLIARNPAADASPPRQHRREITPPTVDQVRLLIDEANVDDPEFGTYLWVLVATGCRRGEACALRWRDIDLEAGHLVIRGSIAMVDGAPQEQATKTHQVRRLSLDEGSIDELRRHRRRIRERLLRCGVAQEPDGFVFADVDGRPWRPDVCTNRFARLRARIGLPTVRLHDLRHFVATVLTDAGLPITTISTRLGHRDTSTTLNLYAHALPLTDQRAADFLGSILRPSG
jgi:integrase